VGGRKSKRRGAGGSRFKRGEAAHRNMFSGVKFPGAALGREKGRGRSAERLSKERGDGHRDRLAFLDREKKGAAGKGEAAGAVHFVEEKKKREKKDAVMF